MNMAFVLWALVHLSLWWSTRNLIVAAGILVLAVGGSIGQDVKKRAVQGRSWAEWERRTGTRQSQSYTSPDIMLLEHLLFP